MRYVSRLGKPAIVVVALGFGCAGRAESPFDTRDWPARIPRGICIIEVGRPGNGGRCTGAIVDGHAGRAYVVTAKHCFEVGSGTADRASILVPENAGQRVTWRRYPATRMLMATGSSTKPLSEDDDTLWRSDWALVEFAPPNVLAAIPLLREHAPEQPKAGDDVVLESFFDACCDTFRPYTYQFKWREWSSKVAQSGHSGAPVIWNGRVVAVFSGYLEKQSLLVFRSRKLAFASADTIRAQATRCRVAFNDDGLTIPTDVKPGCEMLVSVVSAEGTCKACRSP